MQGSNARFCCAETMRKGNRQRKAVKSSGLEIRIASQFALFHHSRPAGSHGSSLGFPCLHFSFPSFPFFSLMTSYPRVSIRQVPKTTSVTAENRYWKQFKNPVITKHYNKITDIEFSPTLPHDFAVTASTRVTKQTYK